MQREITERLILFRRLFTMQSIYISLKTAKIKLKKFVNALRLAATHISLLYWISFVDRKLLNKSSFLAS